MNSESGLVSRTILSLFEDKNNNLWIGQNNGISFVELKSPFRKLNEAGGNFSRFVAAPWVMQLEWEALGNYQPKMGQAWEFDRINGYCTELEIYYLFCGLLHSPL